MSAARRPPRRRWRFLTRIAPRTWSLLLAIALLFRAGSYWFRPPVPTVTTELIEGRIGYPLWAAALALEAALIVTGMLCWRPLAWVGHCMAIGAYSTFALTTFLAAIVYDQPWVGGGLLLLAVLLHWDRMICLTFGYDREEP